MLNVRARNVNTAYQCGMTLLAAHHYRSESRNGPVLAAPEPVCTRYDVPTERVLFDAARDANPFFHLFEAFWMLAGWDDVAPLTWFVPRIAQYSDDGRTLHGAYGARWNAYDQLEQAILRIREDPHTRRAVITLWDPERDANPVSSASKDLPCNVSVVFRPEPADNTLHMMVFNRSNDIVWGCYGANVVHFSVLQEYVAARCGLRCGAYEQISCNYHAYLNVWDTLWPTVAKWLPEDPYLAYDAERIVHARPLVTAPTHFVEECEVVLHSMREHHLIRAFPFLNVFFLHVATPMAAAYSLYRAGNVPAACTELQRAITEHGRVDWLVAGLAWLQRRLK